MSIIDKSNVLVQEDVKMEFYARALHSNLMNWYTNSAQNYLGHVYLSSATPECAIINSNLKLVQRALNNLCLHLHGPAR